MLTEMVLPNLRRHTLKKMRVPTVLVGRGDKQGTAMDAMPIPVPAEAIDMLPPAMWPVYWEMFPHGRQELPATVPFPLWKAQMKKMGVEGKPPPPPPILKSYWGKLSSGPALADRSKNKRKASPEDDKADSRGPKVGPAPPVPRAFWDRYFQLFPHGHCSTGSYEPEDGRPAYDEAEFKKPRYMLRRGTLCVRVSGSTDDAPVYRRSTGCDALDKHGNWIGPG